MLGTHLNVGEIGCKAQLMHRRGWAYVAPSRVGLIIDHALAGLAWSRDTRRNLFSRSCSLQPHASQEVSNRMAVVRLIDKGYLPRARTSAVGVEIIVPNTVCVKIAGRREFARGRTCVGRARLGLGCTGCHIAGVASARLNHRHPIDSRPRSVATGSIARAVGAPVPYAIDGRLRLGLGWYSTL